MSGTVSDRYLEDTVDEVIKYIVEQLAGFLLAAQTREFERGSPPSLARQGQVSFETLYFQLDGQVYIEPIEKHSSVPPEYNKQKSSFWDYTSDRDIWDIY